VAGIVGQLCGSIEQNLHLLGAEEEWPAAGFDAPGFAPQRRGRQHFVNDQPVEQAS